MKEFNELIFKDDARYTQTHEWAKKEGNTVRVGVDDFSQSALGDIVYAELPEVGAEVHAGATFKILSAPAFDVAMTIVSRKLISRLFSSRRMPSSNSCSSVVKTCG